MTSENKLAACLWFDDQGEEAANFYASLFKNARIGRINRYSDEGQDIHGRPAGSVMTVDFELEGQSFVALNGGPHLRFNPSVPFMVTLTSEKEIDELWGELIKGGEALMPLDKYEWSEKYGWLQDRYGLNWQLMLDTSGNSQRNITPLLFFSGAQRGNAERAMEFYTSVFPDSGISTISKYPAEAGKTAGMVQFAQFELNGESLMAMDSGTDNDFPFSEAISLMVYCDNQEEVDYYWEKLGEGGDPKARQCGWLKDKFGFSWQIVPRKMDEFFADEKSEKAKRAMRAMMKMKKLDIAEIEKAYEG